MKIVSIDCKHFRLPLTHPMTDAMHGQMTHFEVVMVQITSDEDVVGTGYTYTIGLGGAAIRSLIEREIKPMLMGADPLCINQLWEKMWWRSHYIGRGGLVSFAIAPVDVALWDLKGRYEKQPLWKILGGYSGQARAYAGGIDLQLSTEELLEQTRENINKGFRAIKMKVGCANLREDVERVAAVRDLIGADMPLMVDANMRWTVENAIKAARQFREYHVYWLEEPTIPDDYEGHARIARDGGVPIATGENLHTVYEFDHMVNIGRVAFPEPDVSNIGGITNWMRVAQLAYAKNLDVTTHGVHELHLHLLAAIPNASYLEVHSFGLERFIIDPPELIEGVMTACDDPGHGIEFDWESLNQHLVE